MSCCSPAESFPADTFEIKKRAPTGDHSCASHTGQSKALQGCRMGVFGEYRHFHSSVGVMTPCMSSSTQDTERLWIPPPQEVEQAVHGLLSQLRLKRKREAS